MESQSTESALRPGDTFGRYVIVRLVGSGGVGEVYEAQHTGLKKRVALKTLHRRAREEPHRLARFLREGEAAAKIRHPNVIDVTDVGVENDVPYLVMEYLEGHDLRQAMATGPLGVAEVAALMLPVIAGVSAAHRCKVVHRDLKPENVFLARQVDGTEVPIVVDFGLSRVLDDDATSRLTATASFMGTPLYMSPEQARGAKDVSERSDQFSLGVILYEMLVGARPFGGENLLEIVHNISWEPAVRPSDARPDLPADLDGPILRALAKSPAERHTSVDALGAALLPHANERTRAVWAPSPREPIAATSEIERSADASSEPRSAETSTLDTAVRVVGTDTPAVGAPWSTWARVAAGVLLAMGLGGAAIAGWSRAPASSMEGSAPAAAPRARPPMDVARRAQPAAVAPAPRPEAPPSPVAQPVLDPPTHTEDAGVDARTDGRRPTGRRSGSRVGVPPSAAPIPPLGSPPLQPRTGPNRSPIIH